MNSEQRKGRDWREFEEPQDAAARLIGVMDERKQRRLAGAETPAEIMKSDAYLSDKAGQNPSANRSAALKDSGRSYTSREEQAGDPATVGHGDGSGLGAGGVVCVGAVDTKGDASMHPPATSADLYRSGFTVDAKRPKARNVRWGK